MATPCHDKRTLGVRRIVRITSRCGRRSWPCGYQGAGQRPARLCRCAARTATSVSPHPPCPAHHATHKGITNQ
eukprot:2168016-Pyramimonas_sp.AAC.1